MPNIVKTDWQSDSQQNVIDIQLGGSGESNWKTLAFTTAFPAPSGGERAVTRLYGDGNYGTPVSIGITAGAPSAVTGTLKAIIGAFARKALEEYLLTEEYRRPCGAPYRANIRVRHLNGNCDSTAIGSYAQLFQISDTYKVNFLPDGDLKVLPDAEGALIRGDLSYDGGHKWFIAPQEHISTKTGNPDLAINAVTYYLGQQFFCITDGAAATDPAQIGRSIDDGKTWTFADVDAIAATETGTDVEIFDAKIFLASPENGVIYNDLPATGLPGAATYTVATVGGSAWATNFPNVVAPLSSNLIVAAGNGGLTWESTDGGADFTANSAVGSSDYTCKVVVNSNLAFFGGTSGKVLRYYDGVWSELTVGSVTDAIVSIDVPPEYYRQEQVYVGTDAGEIYKTEDSLAGSPTWTQVSLPGVPASGSVDALGFTYDGAWLYFAYTASGSSNMWVDRSGGAGGSDVALVADNQASNGGINDIAVRGVRKVVTVGEVESSEGFSGIVTE